MDTALEVPNPTKSWTLYRELHHEGEAEYYKLALKAGERLRISLYVKELDGDFSPQLAVMGEDFGLDDDFPSSLEKPEGYGAIIFNSTIPENREYEPFTPTSYYYLIEVDLPIIEKGEYYVAVFEPHLEEGKYGIALGYKEEYTLSEWVMIPFDVISIHEWEGQSLIEILAPLLLSLVSGFFVLIWKRLIKLNVFNIIGSTAGLLYVGGGLMIFTQMIIALAGAPFSSSAVLTLVFMVLPMILGYLLLRKITRFKEKLTTKDRGIFIVLGVAGVFSWSGLIVGPVLAMLCGLFPIGLSKSD
ncbi:MAG: hypothetical protein ACFFCW_30050 [Candidatus Hodarchaeota archaeon]